MYEYQNAGENCVFFKCEPYRGYPCVGIFQDIRSSSSTKYLILKFLQNSQERTCTLVSCQSATYNFTEKETSAYMFSVNVAKFFRSIFVMRSLLQTGFDWWILSKMTNRHSYYNKEITWSRQLFQRTDIVRGSVNLRTTDRKLILNLILIFNSFTGISFLKYVTKIFYIPYYFQEKHLGVF